MAEGGSSTGGACVSLASETDECSGDNPMTRSSSGVRLLKPILWALALGLPGLTRAAVADDAVELGKIASNALDDARSKEAAEMIERDIARRRRFVNARNRDDWHKIENREHWEKYRDERIERLRRSLG